MYNTRCTQNVSSFAAKVRHCLVAIAVTTAALAPAGPASAGKIADLTSGTWSGGAFTNSHTGSFSHCAVNARYKSGIALYFSVSGKRQWSMAFASDHWAFQQGRSYKVHYQIDDGPVLNGTAIAKSTSLVQVHLPINGKIFSRFAGGSTLKVAAGRRVMRFALTGAGAMLPKLVRCAAHHARKAGADPHSPADNSRGPIANARAAGPLI